MSPRSEKQFEEIREEKRTLIMQTALEHFAKNGYHATTIDHIARHAGISKGLMYNYFESKQALLRAIIEKSTEEIYKYFDINRDGFLTSEEFEIFVRQLYITLKEKKNFWQLFFQLIMQNEVLQQFYNSENNYDSEIRRNVSIGSLEQYVIRVLKDYFTRKKKSRGKDYNPLKDLMMFSFTLKGFALAYVFSEPDADESFFEDAINWIIETYR